MFHFFNTSFERRSLKKTNKLWCKCWNILTFFVGFSNGLKPGNEEDQRQGKLWFGTGKVHLSLPFGYSRYCSYSLQLVMLHFQRAKHLSTIWIVCHENGVRLHLSNLSDKKLSTRVGFATTRMWTSKCQLYEYFSHRKLFHRLLFHFLHLFHTFESPKIKQME